MPLEQKNGVLCIIMIRMRDSKGAGSYTLGFIIKQFNVTKVD